MLYEVYVLSFIDIAVTIVVYVVKF